jgi:hypothetical protein
MHTTTKATPDHRQSNSKICHQILNLSGDTDTYQRFDAQTTHLETRVTREKTPNAEKVPIITKKTHQTKLMCVVKQNKKFNLAFLLQLLKTQNSINTQQLMDT